MASRADVQAFQRSTADLYAVVEHEIRKFWASIDLSTPETARVTLDAFLPDLIATYGEAAALVAADFFDHLRETSGITRRFTAQMADPAPPAQVLGANRWAVGALAQADEAQALANLLQAARRLTVQPARLTIANNAAADPARPGWARVPTGAKTCAFCLMLASRGAVYRSAANAGRMNSYHGDCDCVPTPVWHGGDLPDGYDPDALYERYRAAAEAANGHSTKSVLSELRSREGIA